MGDDLEEQGSSDSQPDSSEYKRGAHIMYVSKGGNEMHIGSIMTVHQDGKGGLPFYTVNLQGVRERQH
jgi:hypothetical protein